MMAADSILLLLRFGAACTASLAVAWLLALLLTAAARRMPALTAHRGTWLLAQAAVALAFLPAFLPSSLPALLPALPAPALPLPHPAALAVIAIDVPATQEEPHAHTAPAAVPQAPATRAAAPGIDAASAGRAALAWLPAAWLAVYLAGLAWHTARRVRASRRWHAWLLRHTRPVDGDALQDWLAVTPDQRSRIAAAGLALRTTDLPLSPVLLGGRRRCLVFPAHLGALDAAQQTLVVEHELTHWRRADPLWLALSGIAALLFWFNRPFRQLAEGLGEAVELGCDDAVLAGRGMRERQGYAAALVAQLKLERCARQAAMQDACAVPAFGQLGVKERVLRMRDARPARLSLRGRMACALAALGTAGFGIALQPALSAPRPQAQPVPAAAAAASTPEDEAPWHYPLSRVRVTGLYGVRSALVPEGHHGVDFAAARGTPVMAPAAGMVVEAATHPRWGNYVRIDHGKGRSSLAIHLERSSVTYGQRVAAGDVIGAAGASGAATGPHLHFEYWQDGRRLDPELMLADLASHATAKARARRQAQGNPLPTDR